jgi:hypothetical protein
MHHYLKFGVDWLQIIFLQILFEGADADRRRISRKKPHLRPLRANTHPSGRQTVTPRLPLWAILHTFIDMPPTNPEPPFEGFNFSYDFLLKMDFGEYFCVGGDFSFLPELDVDFFEESSLGVDSFAYNDVSISHLVDSIGLIWSNLICMDRHSVLVGTGYT